MKHNEKYILYFIAFVVLIIVLYIAGYNVMNAYEEKEKIVNNSNLIRKKLNLKATNINEVSNAVTNEVSNGANRVAQVSNEVNNEVSNAVSNTVTNEVSNAVTNKVSNGVGIIKTPNWREKIKHHMDYKHGNPLMYNNKVKILYDDL
tara:strand:+ start:48 stop:488 length:441 start_codon:yes stop_codon:yes gene_type:complete